MLRTITILAATALAASAADPAPLEAWIRKQADIRSLESDFVQERRLPSLKHPVTTKGKLSFRRPGLMRWELGQPPKTVAVSDGKTLTLAEADARRARRLPVDDPKARRFTLLAGDAFRDLTAFHRAFERRESRVTNGIYQATLRPRDRRMRSNVPWIFLDIDPRNHRLRAFELELKDGSRIRSIFSNTRFNPRIPDSRFQIDLSGYQVR